MKTFQKMLPDLEQLKHLQNPPGDIPTKFVFYDRFAF